MDDKSQKLMDELEKMRIGVDEPFKFSCKQCGKCCINREDIRLNALDVYRLSKKLNMRSIDMINEYAEVYIDKSLRIPNVRLRPRGKIKRCRFLKDRKCSVHDAKPTVCAMFPVGRYNVFDNKDYREKDIKDINIEFILQNPGCGTDETHTVREWLGKFGIPLDDTFFKRWNQTVIEASEIIHKNEGKITKKALENIWKLFYAMLYLSYDIKQDFMPQFEVNVAKMMFVLRLAPSEQDGK